MLSNVSKSGMLLSENRVKPYLQFKRVCTWCLRVEPWGRGLVPFKKRHQQQPPPHQFEDSKKVASEPGGRLSPDPTPGTVRPPACEKVNFCAGALNDTHAHRWLITVLQGLSLGVRQLVAFHFSISFFCFPNFVKISKYYFLKCTKSMLHLCMSIIVTLGY